MAIVRSGRKKQTIAVMAVLLAVLMLLLGISTDYLKASILAHFGFLKSIWTFWILCILVVALTYLMQILTNDDIEGGNDFGRNLDSHAETSSNIYIGSGMSYPTYPTYSPGYPGYPRERNLVRKARNYKWIRRTAMGLPILLLLVAMGLKGYGYVSSYVSTYNRMHISKNTIIPHDEAVNRISFDRSGEFLLEEMDRRVEVRAMGNVQKAIGSYRSTTAEASVSRDGRFLATAEGGTIHLLGFPYGASDIVLRAGSGDVTELAFTPDSKFLISLSTGGDLRSWDIRPGRSPANGPTHSIEGGGSGIDQFSVSSDGDYLLTSDKSSRINIYDTASFGLNSYLKTNLMVKRHAVRNGKVAVYGMVPDTIFEPGLEFWDLKSHSRIAPWNLTANSLADDQCLAYAGDGSRFAFAAGGALVFDLKTHQETKISVSGASVCTFSPKGNVLATAGKSDTGEVVELWNASTGAKIAGLGSGETEITYTDISDVTFSPDGGLLAVSTRKGSSLLWSVATFVNT